MLYLLINLLWMAAAYRIAKTMVEKEGMDVKPLNYALLTFLGGFIFSMSILLNKFFRMKDNAKGCVVTLVIAVFMVVVNLLTLF